MFSRVRFCLRHYTQSVPTAPTDFSSLAHKGRTIAEYIWIGGSGIDVRSKTRVLSVPKVTDLSELPEWNFDGSSTAQAEGHDSEVNIKPRGIWPDPIRGGNNVLVLCDTYIPNNGPANSNFRVECESILAKVAHEEPWFAFEQEYILFNTRVVPHWPLGFPSNGYPPPQGPYYCGVGSEAVFGRELCESHLRACLYAGLNVTGTNFEVFPGQMEFQVGPSIGVRAADELWIGRYLLLRIAEIYGVGISFAPKPMKGDWNGTGCHTNYSTNSTRAEGGVAAIKKYIEKLAKRHKTHIELYGEGNDARLTGRHETAKIDTFRWGVADRGASIRIPRGTASAGKGYLEDRRPAGNADPYVTTSLIADTTLLDGNNTIELYRRYKALHPRQDYF